MAVDEMETQLLVPPRSPPDGADLLLRQLVADPFPEEEPGGVLRRRVQGVRGAEMGRPLRLLVSTPEPTSSPRVAFDGRDGLLLQVPHAPREGPEPRGESADQGLRPLPGPRDGIRRGRRAHRRVPPPDEGPEVRLLGHFRAAVWAAFHGLPFRRWRALRSKLSPVFTSAKIKAMFDQTLASAESVFRQLGKQPTPFATEFAW